ncbi:MAG: DNA methyltransferase [Acidimicrobiales bacterium]
MARRGTSTSNFGVSRRESHDASEFYRRFRPPELSLDEAVASERKLDALIVGDARKMEEVPDASVALVVTSPPYFAGKEYEESVGRDGIPATYLEYLDLLRDVFAECVRKLEPGGRMAINVANLGRKPYRSLSADVIGILQDDLRLLLRGEIIWMKQRGSSGSCAWGSFQRAGNPVLRDLTERIVIASKGRFDRAISERERTRRELPYQSSMTRDAFMEDTLDVWEIPPESATRVGHPAPYPVELPARLIELYTYRGDLVLDPFLGSGTTAVAAARMDRHYVGYDLDESYIKLAQQRVGAEHHRLDLIAPEPQRLVHVPVSGRGRTEGEDFLDRVAREGRAAKDISLGLLEETGFQSITRGKRQPGGVEVSFEAVDRRGGRWLFDVAGSFTSHRSGLARTETLWKALGKAAVLHEASAEPLPLIVLTTDLPKPGSTHARALSALVGAEKPIRAVIQVLSLEGYEELCRIAEGVESSSTIA